MPSCDVGGNDYDKTFEITLADFHGSAEAVTPRCARVTDPSGVPGEGRTATRS